MSFSPSIRVAIAIGEILRSIEVHEPVSHIFHFCFAWDTKGPPRWDVLAALCAAIDTHGPSYVAQVVNDATGTIEGLAAAVKSLSVSE